MKGNKILIGGVVAGLILVAGGVVGWQVWNKRKAEEQRIKDNTVVLESEGYDVGAKMIAWKDKFWTEIINEQAPRYPEFQIMDKDKTLKIQARLRQILSDGRVGMMEAAKKKPDFAEIKEDKQTGSLDGYVMSSDYGMVVRLNLDKGEKYTKFMELNIRDVADAKKSKAVYEKPEIQELIKSIRKTDYKAPKRDYVADRRDLFKMKKIGGSFKDFKIEQDSSDTSEIEVEGKRADGAEIKIRFSMRSAKKGLNVAVADDYFVKNNKEKYDRIDEFDGIKLRGTEPSKNISDFRGKFYFEKDNVVFQGGINYSEGAEAVASEMLKELLKNVEINKDRTKKYMGMDVPIEN